MIQDYATLQCTIGDFLGRSDLNDQIPTFIAIAEGRIYRNLRVNEMEQPLSLTVGSGQATLPADYLDLKSIYIMTDGVAGQPMERVSPFWLRQQFPVQPGNPYYFAREGFNLIFAPTVDGTDVGGIYYARGAGLSDSNTSNWLTTKYPDLILVASLVEASSFIADETAVPYWSQRLTQIMGDIQAANDHESENGSPPVMRRG